MAVNETTPLQPLAQPPRRPRRRVLSLAAAAAFVVALGLWFFMRQQANVTSPLPTKNGNGQAAPSGIAKPGEPEHVQCGTTRQETGYIKLPNKQADYYFYWFHESQRDPAMDPLLVWFTGGPGCSGLMALLTENGPCTVQPNLTTVVNPFSWNRAANVLWIEQPSNVGFSYGAEGDADSTEADVQDNFYAFLQQFLDAHAELRTRELFLAGESYGGHYVPAVAHKIWKQNKMLLSAVNTTSTPSNGTRDELGPPSNETITVASLTQDASQVINLKGIAIGNGLVNVAVQAPHALDMLENGYYNVSSSLASAAREMQPKCLKQLEEAMHMTSNATEIMAKMEACAPAIIGPYMADQRNPYDIRKECHAKGTDMDQCLNHKALDQYLNEPSVKHYLNISTEHYGDWQHCNPNVAKAFLASGDILASCSEYVAELLNDGQIRVLIYAGDADTVCNWESNLAWMTALNWTHQAEFNDAIEHPFELEHGSIEVGRVKAFRDLFTFLRVFNAGHMVPADQPAVSLAMINAFISNQHL